MKNDFSTTMVVQTEQEVSTKLEKSWVERTFSKFDSASLRSSILTLILSSLGTGIFTFHSLFDGVGIILSIVLILLFSALYMMSFDFLTFAAEASPESKSLNELVKNLLGNKASIFYDICFFMNNFIVLIAFLGTISINLYNNFEHQIWWIFSFVSLEKRTCEHFNMIFCFVTGTILFFLNKLKSIEGLQIFSMFSITIFFSTMFVCIFQAPFYFDSNNPVNWLNPSVDGFMTNFGLPIFSYNCLFNFYGMRNALKNPNVRRMRKISFRTFGTLAGMFIVVGLVAYFSLSPADLKTTQLFIFRKQIGDSDYLMKMCRTGLAFSLMIGYAYVTQPLKTMTEGIFNHQNSETGNVLSSLFFSFVPVLFAAFASGVKTYVAISGTLATTIIVFTTPALMALKIGYTQQKWKNVAIWIWLAVSSIFAVVGTYYICCSIMKPAEFAPAKVAM